eukprot:338828_1
MSVHSLIFTIFCIAIPAAKLQQCHEAVQDNWMPAPITIDSIKEDLTAAYYLLDDLKWHDSFYQHISFRYNDGNNSNTIIMPQLSDNNHSLKFEFVDLNLLDEFYKNIYDHRKDINVIIHVHNPDMSAISYNKDGFLPIDQQYYVFYPIAYHMDDIINNRLYTKYNYSPYVLLLNDGDGILIMGKTMHMTFTRFHNIMSAAKAQCIALSILPKDEIILPPQQVQTETIYDRVQVGPLHNFENGIPEYNSFKRKYGYTQSDCQNVKNYDSKNDTDNNIKQRYDLSKLYHLMDGFGWTESIYQHITIRIESNVEDNDYMDRILINPFGTEFGEIEYDKFVELLIAVDSETKKSKYKVVNGGNSLFPGNIQKSCLELHSAIYSYRTDANVAIHIHHPHLSAIGVYKYGLLPVNKFYYNIIKPIAYHSFGSLGHNQNKSSLIDDFGDTSNSLILRNHGIIVTGKNAEDAFNRLYYTIQLAELQVNIMKMGLLNDKMLKDLLNYMEQDNNDNFIISKKSHYNVWERFK